MAEKTRVIVAGATFNGVQRGLDAVMTD